MTKLQKRTILFCTYCMLGIVMIALSACGSIGDFFSGMGFMLVVLGGARLAQIMRYKSDPEYAKKINVMQTDERNLALARHARSIAFTIGVLAQALAVIVFEAIGLREYAQICSTAVMGFVVVYIAAYCVLQRRG